MIHAVFDFSLCDLHLEITGEILLYYSVENQ